MGERDEVYRQLYSERFQDRTPREVHASLLDEHIARSDSHEGVYLCSVRTLYRLLKADGADAPRSRERKHRKYARPELLARGPNQLWSWDITKLKGPAPWTYYHLYVILDVYSRCVVGWMVAYRESQELARELIDETLSRQGILPGELTLHADRGSSMTSKSVALLLSDLGVLKTHSRPHTSNDNPFSESQFKTLKYRPEFPSRFGSLEEARVVCGSLLDWYNGEHHHGGVAMLTPLLVHRGEGARQIALRQSCLDGAYGRHPERFVRGRPKHASLPECVWINPPLPVEPALSGDGCEEVASRSSNVDLPLVADAVGASVVEGGGVS